MNILQLIIKEVHLKNIVNGTKKKETREIRPNTNKKYLNADGCTPRKYDAIQFYAGYNKDRGEALVMVTGANVFVLTDENDKDIVYTHEGKEYVEAEIEFDLGEVVNHKNL